MVVVFLPIPRREMSNAARAVRRIRVRKSKLARQHNEQGHEQRPQHLCIK